MLRKLGTGFEDDPQMTRDATGLAQTRQNPEPDYFLQTETQTNPEPQFVMKLSVKTQQKPEPACLNPNWP